MPERMQQVFQSICSRCGHKWQSRRGKPLRCARCKSPYWDRAGAGRKTRGSIRLPDPRAATGSGTEVSIEQACEILRTWQAERSWVAMTIEDNLALVHCGGYLHAVEPYRLTLSDAPESVVRLFLTLQPKATYLYRVARDKCADRPYATLSIRFAQCLTYLGAFRAQPEKPVWLML
jgi:hypothetical protein